jgi:hypothetical protein
MLNTLFEQRQIEGNLRNSNEKAVLAENQGPGMVRNFAKIRASSVQRAVKENPRRFHGGLEFCSRIHEDLPQLPLIWPLFPARNLSAWPLTMSLTASSLIEVKRIPGKGRGVFAREFIPAGTIFERVPLLVIPAKEVLECEHGGFLSQYVFEYGRGKVALALGFGSLYNHSYAPNARYDDAGRQVKEYKALRDIQPGEEITINYNGAEDCPDPVGFDVLDV